MKKPEWSLILFTLCCQAAVGTVLLFPLSRSTLVGNHPLVLILTALIAVLLFSGILLSFFHLGNPVKAYHSICNIRTSWLSREIMFLLLFSFFTLIWSLLRLSAVAGFYVQLFWLASVLCGIVCVFSMARIYLLRTVPPWNSGYTVISFFLTTLMLGCLPHMLLANSSTQASLLLFVLTLVQWSGWIFRTGYGRANGGSEFNRFAIFTWMRLFFLAMAMTLLVISILAHRNQVLIYLIGLAVLSSELLGRYLFYASYKRLGV